MPFGPGEDVNLRFTGDPHSGVFRFGGQDYTVANGGLQVKRKSALHVTVRLPRQPGKYPYEFETNGVVTDVGHLRVQGLRSPRPARTAPAPAALAAPEFTYDPGRR